ncbi:MAG: hypothetical protein QF486_06525 [Candidatus Woesearchaeota archaeon]|jgi:hypothetical protein|nr:hypothetical protein [Candidatus Woesearchaeota archaeon]MDP7181927.1 hypothetical protein [Candidatus Woesearchaeota archaeon]MDP7199242.1 hypothetical protein [Candidatus Woesearchaeota archaeon]MDP7467855.1 hypothetical protein [Candidatus Woesearchaeota archaeon]MDP7647845.1 hypothetical protein [Candidatus Woesearchaeota archaeon]|tara:strand:+ start:1164 stop:1391 length:228 start_codon:yes stop_codon:yes gene_type:complete
MPDWTKEEVTCGPEGTEQPLTTWECKTKLADLLYVARPNPKKYSHLRLSSQEGPFEIFVYAQVKDGEASSNAQGR